MSRTMKIPARMWENFEHGVKMPGEVLLRFIEITAADPHWLLTGEGARYRDRSDGPLRISNDFLTM